MDRDAPVAPWADRLAIRDVIERSARAIDDRAAPRLAELFDDDGVLQVAGTVFAGRDAIRGMFGGGSGPRPWTEPGELLKQPSSMHLTSNPVIDVDGDTATAETDMVTLVRDGTGRARITLLARYRDRLRRSADGTWLITNRTGVSVAAPGEAGTDAEWARAIAAMPEDVRARFRTGS
jgi:ketosteroid isomerase-like protein